MNRHPKYAVLAGLLAVWLLSISLAGWAATPQEIYQKAGPAVVFITAPGSPKTNHIGTGSIIRRDGLVITNAHIFDGPDSGRLTNNIKVYLKPERVSGNHLKDLQHRYRGRLVAHDHALDLALIQIEQPERPLPRIEFSDSQRVVIGDRVYAIGHPEQGGLWSLTSGVISAFRQNHAGVQGKNLFQTDASINRGNSGGPLLDRNGYMVGINALIAREAPDGLTITDVNFSIMSNVALAWLAELGYRFEAKQGQPSEIGNNAPDSSEGDKARTSEARAKPQGPLQQPEMPRESDAPEILREKPPQDQQHSLQDVNPVPSDATGNESEQSEHPLKSPTAEADPEKSLSGGWAKDRILSPKRPYEISRLLRDMQEMEDMMEDMRGKIKRYKVNK